MAMHEIIVTSREKYNEDFNNSWLTKVMDKIDLGNFYRQITASDHIKDPSIQIDMENGTITRYETHTSLKEALIKDTKAIYSAIKESLAYTADYTIRHPKDVLGAPFYAAKSIATNPKSLIVILIGLGIASSGCITNTKEKPDPQPTPQPTVKEKKIAGTLPGGVNYYSSNINQYDTDGDGKMDIKDTVSDINSMKAHGWPNIAKEIYDLFGIPIESKLYIDYPDIKEFRVRQWDLNKNGNRTDISDKIEILINGEVVVSVTGDKDGDGKVGTLDALKAKGW